MPNRVQSLDYNQSYKIGILSDGSTIYVKRTWTGKEAEYTIVRRMKDAVEFNDMTLDDGYITFSAAAEKAWSFFIMLNK